MADRKYTAAEVIAEARKWNGYLEKKSAGTDEQLQNKTWNAGDNNVTWFWKYLIDKGVAGQSLQGQAWCDAFNDYCHAVIGGIDTAKKSLGGFSYYTPDSAQYFKNEGRWIPSGGTPLKGDQIFFKNSTRINHTGIVTKVTSSTVYTIEGNTSSASGVVANGGAVREKSYARSNSRIAGYGRPLYSNFCVVTKGMTGKIVKERQQLLIDKGFSVGSDGADGDCGANTVKAIKKAQKALNLEQTGNLNKTTYKALKAYTKDSEQSGGTSENKPTTATFVTLKKGDTGTAVKTLQKLLLQKGFSVGSCGADGEFGNDTVTAVKKVQKKAGLDQTGKCDEKTYKALQAMKDSVFTVYSLSDAQIRKITSLCIQEQGSGKAGIMWEASQMCNLWESKSDTTKKKYDNSIYKFIRNCGWYAKAGTHMDKENGSEKQRGYVKEVMCSGKRRLPLCIDEHDCKSDLKSVPSNPVRGKTKITNVYGSSYTYFGKSECGDYFGAINYKSGQPYYTTDGELTSN